MSQRVPIEADLGSGSSRSALAIYDVSVRSWCSISGEWDIASQADTATEAIQNVYAAVDDILAHEGVEGLKPLTWDEKCEFVRDAVVGNPACYVLDLRIE